MKRGLSPVLALFAMLLTVLSVSAAGFAEKAVIIQEAPAVTAAPSGNRPVIITPATAVPVSPRETPVPSMAPPSGGTLLTPSDGYALIRSTGDAGKITLPKQSSYLEEPEMMYVKAGGKNSNYSYLTPWKNRENLGPYPYHGMRVLAVARQDGYTCILFYDHLNRRHASWAVSSGLTYEYPGVEQTVGERRYFTGRDIADPEVTWSRDSFTGTRQKYTILSQPVQGCTQFTLDYHVIARNGAQTKAVLGDRTIYIHNGREWIAVGTFEYPEIDANHVIVNLPEPTDLVAVATTAACDAPDTFKFRQTILDVVVQ